MEFHDEIEIIEFEAFYGCSSLRSDKLPRVKIIESRSYLLWARCLAHRRKSAMFTAFRRRALDGASKMAFKGMFWGACELQVYAYWKPLLLYLWEVCGTELSLLILIVKVYRFVATCCAFCRMDAAWSKDGEDLCISSSISGVYILFGWWLTMHDVSHFLCEKDMRNLIRFDACIR